VQHDRDPFDRLSPALVGAQVSLYQLNSLFGIDGEVVNRLQLAKVGQVADGASQLDRPVLVQQLLANMQCKKAVCILL